jgi:O-antigen/teichoic acid export membrane protein
MGFQRYLLTHILGTGSVKYLGEGIALFSSIIISRYLNPSEIGVEAMVTLFYAFLMRFSDLGISDLVARENLSGSDMKQVTRIFLYKGLILALLMMLISYPVSLFFNDPRLFPIGLCYGFFLFLYALPKSRIAFLRKAQKFTFLAKVEFAIVLLQSISIVILAISGFSYWALILPHFLLPFIYLILLGRKKQFITPGIESSKLFNPGTLMAYIGGGFFIEYWERKIDNLWAGKIYGSETLGLYNRAYMLVTLPVTLLTPLLDTILLPVLNKAKMSSQKANKELFRLYSLLFGTLFAPFLALYLYPEEISVFLWGEEWRGVAPFMKLLCFALFWHLFIYSSRSLYIYFRHERRWLTQTLINGVCTIAAITTGAFYSMEYMIYFYLITLYVIAVPVTAWLGYYKTFGFRRKQLLILFAPFHLAMGFLLFGEWNNSISYTELPLMLMGLLSLYYILTYLHHLMNVKGDEKE